MRVDVVDVTRLDAGPLESSLHATVGTVAILSRGRDVIGVARQAVSNDLGIDPRAASTGVLQLLEHDNAGAFAHDEAIAVFVVRARCPLRLIIEIRRQRAAGCKPGDR